MKKFVLLFSLAAVSLPALAEPSWIWSSHSPKDHEKAVFRKSFDVAGEVKSATLQVSCDNGAKVNVNGKEAADCPDWQQPAKADVAKLLKSGSNELLVNAQNQGGIAALVVKLDIVLAGGKKMTVETGEGWEAAEPKSDKWQPAVVMAKYGAGPWGDVFAKGGGKSGKVDRKAMADNSTAIDPKDINVLPGFKAELLYTVPKAEQGSWVSMTVDPKGRIIACDQYGSLYRVTLPPIGSGDKAQVEQLPMQIGGAHGLLYAFNSLYLMLNEKGATPNKGRESGVWRMKDKGDGNFEEPVLLRAINGGGEHGPHSFVLSPDGKSIFFNCGNHTKLPENFEISRAAKAWDEDHVLPRMWDANGHARGILAPGGYVCKTDPDLKKVEVFCYGFRNEFDIAFNSAGELFTYDADMEWDMGAPWYRPTRINHCVSGADYGWRSGSGKWPSYYPDSLPATVDIGPGSPTGVVAGTGAMFPAKYQRCIYGADWTYGTMYAIHSTPKGGTYESVKEEFVSGKPLPLTDVLIHPNDGSMYFAIGGRRTQSALYRVTYIGKESTAPADPLPLTPEMKLRHELEKLHEDGTGPGAIDKALPHLSHPDRFVRTAARIVIERQPVDQWKEKVLALTEPNAVIEGMIALARIGRTGNPVAPVEGKPAAGSSSGAVGPANEADAALQIRILESLGKLEGTQLSYEQTLAVLRTIQLAIVRLGKPAPEVAAKIAEKLDDFYPSKDSFINRELCQILIVLDSPTVVSKTLGLMATAKDDHEDIASESLLSRNEGYANAAKLVSASRPNKQQISYMFALRNATAGWTPESRKTFFSWFPHARTWKGGNSFKGFIENIRKEALAKFVPQNEVAELDALSSRNEAVAMPNITPPKGPGRAWTIEDVLALAKDGIKGRNYDQGKNLFAATMCLTCHRFNGDGGGIGPDLTGAGSRYTLRDLMENIIDPSKVISDQYGTEQIEKKDGTSVIGRIIVEENDKVFVMTNPFAPNDHVAINAADIRSKKVYPVSMMPPGMINVLSPDELLDLLAYVLSAGNPEDKVFK
ncbi:MAG: c-type cytochrome [Verrucomicrobiaceae bacterium]|nr:c-type cytochrome [Verrucomicrobiaceae bacterium]